MTMAATRARADFQRARRRHLTARACRRLTARRASSTRPRDLGDVAALFWRPARLRSIPIKAIVGTVDATADFDASFRPATDRVSPRWQRIARAHRDGRPLPPVDVIERPDGYYILDGRHRVSVARAFGHRDIDAWTSPAPLAPQARPQHPSAGDHGRPNVCDPPGPGDAACTGSPGADDRLVPAVSRRTVLRWLRELVALPA
jgi:hypothetical protein